MIAIGKMQIVQLIVVDFARFYSCGLRIPCVCAVTRFGVQQGILGVIVEVVAFCRGKGGSGRADGCLAVCRFFARIKFVGVEADFAVFGVIRNVGGKGGVGKAAGRNLVAHTLFKADRVDDADGLGVVDFQLGGAIGACGLIIPQGQHTGRDLDLHAVADTAAATGDGDNDVAQIGCIGVGTADRVFMLTLKDIGILRVGAGSLHLRKDLVGKGNGLKALDFHIIAQGIIESHVAFFLGLVRNLRGACRCGRYRREDVRKDILQLISAGSRHIVVCLVRSVAEVPFPGTEHPRWIIRFPGVSGRGVVAGDRLHELVFFCSSADIGLRVSTLKNADRVNHGTRILEGFSRFNRIGSNVIIKPAVIVRRAIGKEDDDLFGIGARRSLQRSLGLLQAIVRPCGTFRPNSLDCGCKLSGTVALTYGKILYDLRVVFFERAVGIIANRVLVFARKFHDGKPDFLILIRDFLILLRSAVNKVSDGIFQRVNALCAVAIPHGIVHTAGGIQHQHYIQRLCIGGSGRRMGGQRRQRDQEISAFIFGHRDGVLACQVAAEGDLFFLHRFIGPNTACGGVVIGLCVLPRIKRVGIADGFTVGSCLCRGVFPLCIGRDRDQHREQECQRQQGGLQPYEFTVHSFHSILSLCCGTSINKQGQAPVCLINISEFT